MLKEIAEKSAVSYHQTDSVEFIVNLIDNASAIVTFRSRWPATKEEQVKMFEFFDPIWDMLTETRNGLLHIDGGSFWNKEGTVLFSNSLQKPDA